MKACANRLSLGPLYSSYMCLFFTFHCRRPKTRWGWCSTNWGRRRGIWWGVPVRQPVTHTVEAKQWSHNLSKDFTHAFHKICFPQWKMRILTWMFQKTKVLTATWKSVDLLSHGPYETASWQVYSQWKAMSLIWSTISCLEKFAETKGNYRQKKKINYVLLWDSYFLIYICSCLIPNPKLHHQT